MAFDGYVMIVLFQLLTIFLLLLTIRYVVPQMHPILYSGIFLFLFAYVTLSIFMPFIKRVLTIFEGIPEPFGRLLLLSAFLFFISEFITQHIAESGYSSLANLAQIVMKITILSLWFPQLIELIQILTTLITT